MKKIKDVIKQQKILECASSIQSIIERSKMTILGLEEKEVFLFRRYCHKNAEGIRIIRNWIAEGCIYFQMYKAVYISTHLF